MPLTISHPAAAIPLTRLSLVLSALVLCSMTPDFPYFISIFPYGSFSHSILGMFVYCVPVGLISLAIFHFLIKYPALSLFPISHQQRLFFAAHDFSFWPLRRFLLIILSILLGAFTHIIWDSFTHPQGWMVEPFVILKSRVFYLPSVPIYEFLQHYSSLFGGVLLCYWYVKWYKSAELVPVPQNLKTATSTKLIILAIMSFIAFMIPVFSGVTSIPAIQTLFYRRLFNGYIFVVSVSTFVLELIIFSVYWHFHLKKKNTL